MRSHLLDMLDDDEQREVLAAGRRRRFKRNEVVFHDGDPGDTLHIVVKGHFAIRFTTPLGDQATVRVFGPADYFGELAMLSAGPRRGSAISLDGGETLSVDRGVFEELRATRPKVNEMLTEALVGEVRRLSAALLEALYVPVQSRVWLRLIDLVEVYGGDAPVVIPLTQDDIAQLAGTTRPTANRVLRSGEEKAGSFGWLGSHRDPRSHRTTTTRSLILSGAPAGTSRSFRIPSPWSSGRLFGGRRNDWVGRRAVQQTRRSRSSRPPGSTVRCEQYGRTRDGG